jgi:toxin CptA
VSLRPSRALAAVILVAHGAAVVAATAALPWLPALIVGLGLVVSGVHHVRIALHRSALAIAGLEFSSDGRLALASPGGEWRAATLTSAVVPAAWLAVLTARDDIGRRRAVVILPDAIEHDTFRKLRVWLLWRNAAVPPNQHNDTASR